MKGKLIKLNVGAGYRLDDEYGNLFASTLQSSKNKLLFKNCDEIFGIVNAESEFYKIQPNTLSPETEHKVKVGFIMGFNKAMSLNKDKLFTVEDMRKACSLIFLALGDGGDITTDEVIQSLQQPKEIEVEVVMDKIPADLAPGGWDVFPRLDKEGCIILKRVV